MAVVVRYEDAEHLFEMSSAQDQEPIEAFGASGADKALGDSVRSWRANGRPDDLEVLAQENGVEAAAELTVAIVDEEAEWCRPLGQRPGQLASLLGHPGAVRVRAAAREVDAPAAELDKEQHVQAL